MECPEAGPSSCDFRAVTTVGSMFLSEERVCPEGREFWNQTVSKSQCRDGWERRSGVGLLRVDVSPTVIYLPANMSAWGIKEMEFPMGAPWGICEMCEYLVFDVSYSLNYLLIWLFMWLKLRCSYFPLNRTTL